MVKFYAKEVEDFGKLSTVFPNNIIDDFSLLASEFKILCYLIMRQSHSLPSGSINDISIYTNQAKKTVTTQLRSLIKKGHITIVKEYDPMIGVAREYKVAKRYIVSPK